MKSDNHGSAFAGFRKLLRKGMLTFLVIMAALAAAMVYQTYRSKETVRSVEHTRHVIEYINALRVYLLSLDTAVRTLRESGNPAALDSRLVCADSGCPRAEELIAMIRDDGVAYERLAPLPALQSALETGFAALREQAQARRGPMAERRDLVGFDKSAIEQIHRILIETERDVLDQLNRREAARIHDQNLASGLLGVVALLTALALFGLYRETTQLIAVGIHAEQTIRELSLRDPLTGLANRRFLQEHHSRLMAAAKRSRMQMAVLAVDLDDFKAVNDRHGHAAGDEVLVAAAERMQHLIRESDVIARLGGDEFVIVLQQVEDAAAAREVASRVVESLGRPIPLASGESARVGASVGVAMYGGAGETLDDLLKAADTALYKAKREGKSTFRAAGSEGA